MRTPEPEETAESYTDYYQHMLAATEGLPPTALVLAADAIDFTAIFRNRCPIRTAAADNRGILGS